MNVLIVDDCTETRRELSGLFFKAGMSIVGEAKSGIEAIELGHHVLLTAHTGSGKTLSAEHAIQRFCRAGQKVVYTAPIKSLSNQNLTNWFCTQTEIE